MSDTVRRVIHYMSLVPGFEALVGRSLGELNEQLASHYPKIPGFEVCPLDADSRWLVHRHFQLNMPGCAPDDDEQLPELSSKRLFVLVDEEHPFVAEARMDNPLAH